MNEHNEPWTANKMSYVNVAIIEKSNGDDVGYDFTHEEADRITDSVNACAGVEFTGGPLGAVKRLVEVFQKVKKTIPNYEYSILGGEIESALAAFEVGAAKSSS